MEYRDLFGNDLSEYEIDVLIDSGIQASEWERISRMSSQYALHHDSRSTRHFISKALKVAGVGIAGISALSKLTYNWATTDRTNPNKRLRETEDEPDKRQKVAEGMDEEPLEFKRSSVREQSLLNLQQDTDMPTAIGSGNAAGLKETPVDKVRNVHRGPPEEAFASLPYVRDVRLAPSGISYDVGFRMTSPYDPSMTLASPVDINAGAGTATTTSVVTLDSSDTTITSARWYDFYSTLYNYYHVVSAKWHITIENMKNDPLWCHMLYINDEVPPPEATNEDIMCWPDTESHLLGVHAVGIKSAGAVSSNHDKNDVNNVEGNGAAGTTANYENGNHVNSRGVGPILKLSGQYRPGQFRRQIHLDSEVENWTAINANPSLPERLLFRFKPVWNGLDTNDAVNYDRTFHFRVNFRIDYLVEFKELKYGLRWPVERQPVIAAVNTNAEEDEE